MGGEDNDNGDVISNDCEPEYDPPEHEHGHWRTGAYVRPCVSGFSWDDGVDPDT